MNNETICISLIIFKGIVHPKMKICLMSLFLHQICRNVASSVAQQWMLCSEWVPSEWESKQLIKTHNPQVIHTTPVHQLTSGEDKSCTFIRNKSIIKTFLTSNCRFQLKYESIIHNNASSSEKVFWSESGEKSAQIKHCLQAKTVQNRSKQVCGWILMWETTGDGLFLWRDGLQTCILARNNSLK